jgi:hypothetical protein
MLIASVIVLLIGVVLILLNRPRREHVLDLSRADPERQRAEGAPVDARRAHEDREARRIQRADGAPVDAHEDSEARRSRITREMLAARNRFDRRLSRGRRRRRWLVAAFVTFALVLVVVLAVVASTARAV